MKTQSKPIVALAFGALLLGVTSQVSHAQGIVASNEVQMPANNNVPADALTVQSWVTLDAGTYTYNYNVINPATDTTSVNSFTVDFDAAASGAVEGTISGGDFSENNGANGITWLFFFNEIAPGQSSENVSGDMSFNSQLAPTLANADANGDSNPPAPWASNGSSQLYVPKVVTVPEPPAELLLGLGLMLPAIRSNLLKVRNTLKRNN